MRLDKNGNIEYGNLKYIIRKSGSTKDHYVTVTGMIQDDDRLLLEISSWGQKFYIDYKEYTDYVKKCDNYIFSNISKYAMEGTRVYIDVKEEDENVRIEMKNISAAPLNISSEELMERFVRGDSSRSTEGSGLGLSIAASLTALMGGSLKTEIDGDLFKVILLFHT